MRVDFDHKIFSMQKYGGISRYFFELAKNIPHVPESDWSAKIRAGFYRNSYLVNNRDQVSVSGVYVPSFKGSGTVLAWANKIVPSFSFSHAAIEHATYYTPKRRGQSSAAQVISAYDMIHELFPSNFSENDQTRELKRRAFEDADHIISISQSTKNDIMNLYGVDAENISVVPLGFSLSAKAAHDEQAERSPFILFVGARGGYKNFEGFVRAFAGNNRLFSNFKIVVFGGGALSASEKQLLASLKIDDEKFEHHSGSDEALAQLYQQAALFVYPSMYEGFGIPPLEAMFFDCPVAASDAGSIPEVVGQAAALFDPHDQDSISSAIERCISDGELSRTLVERGRERLSHFSWENCAYDTIKVYESIL